MEKTAEIPCNLRNSPRVLEEPEESALGRELSARPEPQRVVCGYRVMRYTQKRSVGQRTVSCRGSEGSPTLALGPRRQWGEALAGAAQQNGSERKARGIASEVCLAALTADKSVCFAIPKILTLLLASEHNLITSDNVIHSKDYLHRVLGILLKERL